MKILFILLLLSSCSIFKTDSQLSENSKDLPAWIYSPYEGCEEQAELCATGESKTQSGADASARAGLASIFEVKVTSEFSASSTSQQNFPWLGAVQQEVQQSLRESVDQVLETVQIKKRFKSKGLTYALASLDREKASELIGGRLKKIDDELNVLWSKRSRTNLRKILKLSLEREKLNERFSIVSGSPREAVITHKEIIQWRQSRPKTELLALRIGQAPEWMSDKLKELLTEAGFRIVKGDAEKAVSLNVESIKEFLNVEGFEKYTFTMNLISFEKGEKNKVIAISETVTGRSQADALLKVKNYFNNYLEQHLSDLDLD
jgi:hypothetical protein